MKNNFSKSSFPDKGMVGGMSSSPDKGRLGGVFIPYNPKLKEYAKQNRKNPTIAEQKMWQILKRKQFENYKFTRQKPLLTYIADFYCAELQLVIEIDGDTHAERAEYDLARSNILKDRYSIDVIRFNNSDVLYNLEGVYETLLEFINKKELDS